jgi:peptidoglycan/LPS O-acetylase OafA/YrhL
VVIRETDGKFGHIPALDGVRALAVLAVLAYHLGAGWLPGGFLGVDIFFVLSGFLITTLLLAEFRASGRIDLVKFWLRRARRLLPALFVVLALVVAYTATRPATEQLPLRWDLLSSLMYAANWRFVLAGESYFAEFVAPSPVKHLWSLAIEEQFYLLFPLILLGAAILRRRSGALAVLWVLVTASSAVALALTYDAVDPSRAYYGTDTRAHQLLIGVGLAFLLRPWTLGARHKARPAGMLAAGGLAGVIGLMLVTTDKGQFYYYGGSVLVALAAAALIAGLVTGGDGLVGRLLATRPAVAIGVISYGLYLWHWPVIVILTAGRTGLSGVPLALVQAGVALAASATSYLVVERPIRRGRLGRIHLRPTHVFPAAAAMVVVLAGCTLIGTAGARPDPAYASQTEALFVAPDAPAGPSVPGVGLVGDSVAVSLRSALGTEFAHHGVRLISTSQSGCGVGTTISADANGHQFGYARKCPELVPRLQEELVAKHRPRVILWYSGRDRYDLLVGGTVVKAASPEWIRRKFADWDKVLDRLVRGGAHVVVVLPVWGVGDQRYGCHGEFSFDPAACGTYHVTTEHMRRLYRQWAARHPHQVTLSDFSSYVCPAGPPCPKIVDGIQLREDGVHYSEEGAHWLAARMTSPIVNLVCPPDRAGTCRSS